MKKWFYLSLAMFFTALLITGCGQIEEKGVEPKIKETINNTLR